MRHPKIVFAKGKLNFCSKNTAATVTVANVRLLYGISFRQLAQEHNHVIVDKIHALLHVPVHRLLVSGIFLQVLVYKLISQPINPQRSKDTLTSKELDWAFYKLAVNSSNSCDRLSQVEEQNYDVEITKLNQFSL